MSGNAIDIPSTPRACYVLKLAFPVSPGDPHRFPFIVKSKPLALFAGSCIAGLALGYGAKLAAQRGSSDHPPATADADAPTKGRRDGKAGGATGPVDLASVIPTAAKTRSTETLESLKADSTDLYARLALWMVDASQEDVKAFWEHYRTQPNRSNDINDVIFINWARIDPLAATAAAKGTPDEHYAWWAWACHDPQAALDAAIATNPDRINNVTWGIGEFHPDWTMKHFDELPEGSRDNALRGLAKWDDREHPKEVMDFLKEKGYGSHSRLFKVLTLRDPWGAYDWIEENGKKISDDPFQYGNSDSMMNSFVNSMALYHPDVLKRVAENSPPGELRRKMEDKAFQSLLKVDLDAAAQQAEETKGSAVATSRLLAVGLQAVKSDPERAFEYAKRVFEICPNPWENGVTVMSAGGGSQRWGTPDGQQMNQLLGSLIEKDPRRAMELGSAGNTEVFGNVASLWVGRDPQGFADWVESQPQEKRQQGGTVLVNHLMQQGDFSEAAEWATTFNESTQHSYLMNVMSQWSQTDPDSARAWMEKAELPEQMRKSIEPYLNQ